MYVILSSLVNIRQGPTVVGDETSDEKLMKSLGAILKTTPSNLTDKVWESPDNITNVMNKLEGVGFVHVATSGLGQTYMVTMCAEKGSNYLAGL